MYAGAIPPELGALRKLVDLYLTKNELEGEGVLTSSFGRTSQLSATIPVQHFLDKAHAHVGEINARQLARAKRCQKETTGSMFIQLVFEQLQRPEKGRIRQLHRYSPCANTTRHHIAHFSH